MADTEQTILNNVYTNVEGDTDNWSTTSDEYLAGRRFANQAISKWENHINSRQSLQKPIRWRALWTNLTAAADGTKTLTAATYAYGCPTNFKFPGGYVRTVNSSGDVTYWDVIDPEVVAETADSNYHFVYFTGNPKDGYKLNFNPNLTLTTGHTINYEYYKTASTFTATTSTSEVEDPYFIVSYVTAQFFKDEDIDIYNQYIIDAEARLDQMATNNDIGVIGVDDQIEETLAGGGLGFGN